MSDTFYIRVYFLRHKLNFSLSSYRFSRERLSVVLGYIRDSADKDDFRI